MVEAKTDSNWRLSGNKMPKLISLECKGREHSNPTNQDIIGTSINAIVLQKSNAEGDQRSTLITVQIMLRRSYRFIITKLICSVE